MNFQEDSESIVIDNQNNSCFCDKFQQCRDKHCGISSINFYHRYQFISIPNPLMYLQIISKKHTFQHNSSARLLCGLPISLHKVLLFYSNGRYFQYDLCQSKILNPWMLLEKPLKVVLSGPQQALVITQSRKLVELNLQKNTCTEICKLPRVITGNELKDKSTFCHSEIVPFRKSLTFYIRETVEDDNKIRIIFFTEQRENGYIKEFENIMTIIEPIDEYSKIAVYRQNPEIENKWEVRIIDLKNNFYEKKYSLEHKAFACCNTVLKTLTKTTDQLLIFINGPNPEILVLDLQKGDIKELLYKPQPNFIDIGFYNKQKGILCLFYIYRTQFNDEIYENLMEVVDIETGRVLEKSYLTIGNPTCSLENQFILDIPMEPGVTNSSKFFTRHFIGKRSLYFDMLVKTQVREGYGDKLCARVIGMLRGG